MGLTNNLIRSFYFLRNTSSLETSYLLKALMNQNILSRDSVLDKSYLRSVGCLGTTIYSEEQHTKTFKQFGPWLRYLGSEGCFGTQGRNEPKAKIFSQEILPLINTIQEVRDYISIPGFSWFQNQKNQGVLDFSTSNKYQIKSYSS